MGFFHGTAARNDRGFILSIISANYESYYNPKIIPPIAHLRLGYVQSSRVVFLETSRRTFMASTSSTERCQRCWTQILIIRGSWFHWNLVNKDEISTVVIKGGLHSLFIGVWFQILVLSRIETMILIGRCFWSFWDGFNNAPEIARTLFCIFFMCSSEMVLLFERFSKPISVRRTWQEAKSFALIQVFRCKSDSERCHRERTSLKMDCLDKSLCLTCSRLNGLAYLAFVGHHWRCLWIMQ